MRCLLSSICCARKSTRRCGVVLGHFVFVYIHPYMDGNGRMGALPHEPDDGGGRLSVDGHTALRAPHLYGRSREASVEENIALFAEFLAGLVRKGLRGEPLPPVPNA